MPNNDDWEGAVKKLLTLTESEKLNWSTVFGLDQQRENVVGDGFVADVEKRSILVYEYRFKAYADEDTWSWEEEVAIELVEFRGDKYHSEWRWPTTRYGWRLLDAIRCQRARAPEFLRAFLGEESTA